ncbi:MAG: hypothetical protein QXU18_06575 [Thermoplasmatales archaeon]
MEKSSLGTIGLHHKLHLKRELIWERIPLSKGKATGTERDFTGDLIVLG